MPLLLEVREQLCGFNCSFHFYVGSRDWMPVTRLTKQVPFPTEPSPQPKLGFSTEKRDTTAMRYSK